MKNKKHHALFIVDRRTASESWASIDIYPLWECRLSVVIFWNLRSILNLPIKYLQIIWNIVRCHEGKTTAVFMYNYVFCKPPVFHLQFKGPRVSQWAWVDQESRLDQLPSL